MLNGSEPIKAPNELFALFNDVTADSLVGCEAIWT